MKIQRRKRSEPFWPSIVMKKWLNIKPKVYDFSEDELDTETESEDEAYSMKDKRNEYKEEDVVEAQGKQSQPSGKFPRACCLRHRRGKSETLRAQYINTKDVRVTVGTWNVAGRAPHDDLEIDEWLSMQHPADIYILGFQEVVPLSAGNVLGAESRRPILKWEAKIRQTLNKSLETESKPKSYSAPPSPVLRTSSAADILADAAAEDVPVMEMPGEEQVRSSSFRLKRVYGIDCDSRLDWPERPLDQTAPVVSSPFKLRRVLSSSARVGSDQVGGLDAFNSLLDGSEQCWEDTFSGDKNVSRQRYVRIISKQMVGIYVSVWVRRKLRRHIHNLRVSPVGVGLMGYMGNKGSVSVSMSMYQSRMCFVCSHLTSGQEDGARRNSDVFEILRRTSFSSVLDAEQPLTIPSHDQIFWFGDLNYRINMEDSKIRKLVANKQWDQLLKNDQLCEELRSGHVFEGWKEGAINFAPTYKYEFNSDRYVGENPREGEKKRSPAWCDRVLWLGKGIRQLSYKRAEIRLSDHRPVSSSFLVEVEIFHHHKLRKALNFISAVVHPEIFLDEDGDSFL